MRHLANTEQAQAWNGYEGTHWARNQDRWDAVNAGFNEPLLTAAAIGERDQVLDIGCGAGKTARIAARQAAHGQVLGLDLSAPMLERARATTAAEGIGNATFEHGDAQVHPLKPGTFDKAISRFGVMFFADPVTAFSNIGRALRPEGRMAFICAADPGHNDWVQAMAALREYLPTGDIGGSGRPGHPGRPGMFSLADPDRISTVLSAAGFVRVGSLRLEAYGNWGRDAEDTASFLLDTGPGRHLTGQVDQRTQDRARALLVDYLRDYERHGTVRLRSTAWLVTAERPA